MTISREAVEWGFRFFLGREPGSEEAIRAHMRLKSPKQLAETLLTSSEFATGKPYGHLVTVNRLGNSLFGKESKGRTPALRILVLGNCQARGLARLMQAMAGDAAATHLELSSAVVAQMQSGEIDLKQLLAEPDLIFMHPHTEALRLVEERHPALRAKIRLVPTINFSAFQPDVVYVRTGDGGHLQGAMGEYQSSIALLGWKCGLTVEQTTALFQEEIFDRLGFFEFWPSAVKFLEQMDAMTGIPVASLADRWSARGCWMHTVNHPKLHVLADVAREALSKEGIAIVPDAEQYVTDDLAAGPVWPVFREVGRRLGLAGNDMFKRQEGDCPASQPVQFLRLAEFVQLSYEAFARHPKEELRCDRLESAPYQELAQDLAQGLRPAARAPVATDKTEAATASAPPEQAQATGDNPYRGLPDYQFWRRGVERVPMNDVDPVVGPLAALEPQHKVATAGSCFAQHISRTLQKSGFNYYVAETAQNGLAQEAAGRNFGVFSARYGNIYTARQLVQLFDRAYGSFTPEVGHWLRPDGRFVDPFRPQIEPDGFGSIEELEASRQLHLESVRRMFETLDVFVFTLGLTEAWRSKVDGAVFPLAPGVAGGAMDPERHEFINFGVEDVVSDMESFIDRLVSVNPRARMILTVSPVPLIATYEPRHVLVSSTYSKAVLRAAADAVCRRRPVCEYFPSFEIITGSFTRGEYFEDDLRSVRTQGVDHVMRIFMSHYFGHHEATGDKLNLMDENAQVNAIVCDEEAIDTRFLPAPKGSASLGRIAGRLKSLVGIGKDDDAR